MKSTLLLSLALGVSWTFSPEALVIAGNVSGQLGFLILPSLVAVAVLFGVCSRLLRTAGLPSTADREFLILQKGYGSIAATTLSLAACLPLTILAGTALLVTAGYTFNEVFLYWFPNFAFSFLLLALLTILQFFRKEYARWLQLCFIGLAMGGLLLLALSGILSADTTVPATLEQSPGFSLSSASLLLLLFIGHNPPLEQKESLLPPALAVGFLIVFLWVLVSLKHVPQERLATSTIPYMSAARSILGEPGRQLMGLTIISGTCGAVNGLMLLCRNTVATLSEAKAISNFFSSRLQRWLLPSFLATAITTCMATGLAGAPLLEALLRSALILWLLYYGLLCLSAVRWTQKISLSIPYPALICTLLLLAGAIILVVGDPRRREMSIFILSMGAAGSLLSACCYLVNRHFNHPPQP